MSPEQREKFRWHFAGQAMLGFISHNPLKVSLYWDYAMCVTHADNLVAELEKSGPKETCCDHQYMWSDAKQDYALCRYCGEIKE